MANDDPDFGDGAPVPEVSALLSRLRLDDLLSELQTRLETARATRDRMRALLEAVVSISSDLDLETVLRRLVKAAATLVDARGGALGMTGEDRERLVRFVTAGVTEEEITAIGGWLEGHGVLGRLVKEPEALLLSDLGALPEPLEFPTGHRSVRGFLGVPIRVRDEVFGILYLIERRDGHDFGEEDEAMLSALVTAAGVAIENARLYDLTRRRERWLEASAEISTALVSGGEVRPVTELVAQRVREIAGGTLAAVVLADERFEEFTVASADGEGAGNVRGVRFVVGGVFSEAFCGGHACRFEDGSALVDGTGPFSGIGVGPLLVVPLGTGTAARGVVLVSRPPQGPVFDDGTQQLLEAFCGQAAVALELAARRRDVERLALLEDRDRIGRDLHDTVIQRLFATAMKLMAAIKKTEVHEVRVRVERAVDDLDDIVRQIRSTVFALQGQSDDTGLCSRVHALLDDAAEQLGYAPSARLDGLLDTTVPDDVAEHLLAVVREALSNVARHAQASRADMVIEVAQGELALQVFDNGVGIRAERHSGGLRNMACRAEELGGSLEVRELPEGGTALAWRVPLASARGE